VFNEWMLEAEPNARTWVEIHNPTGSWVSPQGMTLAIHDGVSDGETTDLSALPAISPGGFVVLCERPDLLAGAGATCHGTLQRPATLDKWYLVLKDSSEAIVDEIRLDQPRVDTNRSLARRNPFMDLLWIQVPASNEGVPSAWAGQPVGLSTVAMGGSGLYGTPGATNSDVWTEIDWAECADGDPCSWDRCMLGVCDNSLARQNCCTTSAQCDDSNPCTSGSCLGNQCIQEAISGCCEFDGDCIDENPCTMGYCMANRCRYARVNAGVCCWSPADANPSTGTPWSPAERQAHADLQCLDAHACTTDTCNLATTTCEHQPRPGCCITGSQCDDGDPCTWDLCVLGQCVSNLISPFCCTGDGGCDDGDPCTRDLCFFGRCRFFFDASICCTDDAWCRTHADDGDKCTIEQCVTDPVTGYASCQHTREPICRKDLPLEERFDGITSIETSGWTITDLGSDATANWVIRTGESLGPDPHLDFVWNPAAVLVKSVALSPMVDASNSNNLPHNILKTISLQWRMAYRHAQDGSPVTLRVVATNSDQPEEVILWEATTNQDIPFRMYDVEIPQGLRTAATLRVGFMMDTGSGSTFDLVDWQIDDVRLATGVPNDFLHAKVYRCAGGTGGCELRNAVLHDTFEGPQDVRDLTMTVCDWYRIIACFEDKDAYYSTWNFYGFPSLTPETEPAIGTAFIGRPPDVGQGGLACETTPFLVRGMCGVEADSKKGFYYCGMDLKPDCNDGYADRYRMAMISKDEGQTLKSSLSPFESWTENHVNVLLRDGYIVWSPLDWKDPSAIAIRDSIRAAGRKAQIIKDLDLIQNLAPYSGIFAVLGVTGRHHVLGAAEANRLKAFLDGGGKVYLEGGDFFFTGSGGAAATVLHPYFSIEGTSPGDAKVTGTLAGKNFLFGYDFDYSTSAVYNSLNDKIRHVQEGTGKEILHVEGDGVYGAAVAFQGSGGRRTVGTSLAFGGLVERTGGKTRVELMNRLISFFETGWPGCTMVQQCEDFEACTTDTCSSGHCTNNWRSGCVPCVNDGLRPSGNTSACSINRACDVAAGYCVDIRCGTGSCLFREDPVAGELSQFFGSSPSLIESDVVVARTGLIRKIQVKVRITHTYRGHVRISLRGPDGTTVMLKDADLTDAGRNVYETYDIGVPTPGGQSLDAFLEQEYQGTWTLIVEDLDPWVHNGILEQWWLHVGKSPRCNIVEHCDDSNVCTVDACVDNLCQRPPLNCNDNNVCTDDGCHTVTGCFHVNNTRGCETGDLCTEDFCQGGGCQVGPPKVCNDGKQCTDDSCDPAIGCVFVPDDTNVCSDGIACTWPDLCDAGTCVSTLYQCDDGHDCTTDVCLGDGTCNFQVVPGWCLLDGACVPNGTRKPDNDCFGCVAGTHRTQWTMLANQTICDDGDPCTYQDACQAGACVAVVNPCDDENECTDDSCEPGVGCRHEEHTRPCVAAHCDGSAFIPTAYCAGGVCGTPASVPCNDGNVCTDDSCDPGLGCVNVANGYTEPCYSGPNGTEDVGECKAGERTCSGGALGACEGEVLPVVPEQCDGLDDDCNGVTDNGC
jgi:subtilisin-like proprotein convertase family protein